MASSCLGKTPRCNRLWLARAASDSRSSCMRQEKNRRRRRGLSRLAFPCSPSLVARCNPFERSHTGVISLSSASVQMNIIKITKPPCTLDTQPTHTQQCVSLDVFPKFILCRREGEGTDTSRNIPPPHFLMRMFPYCLSMYWPSLPCRPPHRHSSVLPISPCPCLMVTAKRDIPYATSRDSPWAFTGTAAVTREPLLPHTPGIHCLGEMPTGWRD